MEIMVNNSRTIFCRRNCNSWIFNILVWNRSTNCNDSQPIYIKHNNSNNSICNNINNINFCNKTICKEICRCQKTNTNVYSIIGKKALVIKTIDPIHSVGQIKLNGEVWTAESENNEIIEEGSKVEIQEIKGVKAIVKPIKIENKI